MSVTVWSTGELQEWWNPPVAEVCPSWKCLRAQVSALWEGGREREGRPPPVCVPEGKTPNTQRRRNISDDWPQADNLEPGVQERRILELREVPHRAGRCTVQALQPEVPHHRHRGRHQEAPQPGELKPRPKCWSSLQLSTMCVCVAFITRKHHCAYSFNRCHLNSPPVLSCTQ